MWPNPQVPPDLVTFTEKSLMETFIFYAVKYNCAKFHYCKISKSDVRNKILEIPFNPQLSLKFLPLLGSSFLIKRFYQIWNLMKSEILFEKKLEEKSEIYEQIPLSEKKVQRERSYATGFPSLSNILILIS